MMNNSPVTNTHIASSFSEIALFNNLLHPAAPKYSQLYPRYSFGNGRTYDSSNWLTKTQYDFHEEILSLYTRLAASQKTLGAPFEKVLFDNLWDLYEN